MKLVKVVPLFFLLAVSSVSFPSLANVAITDANIKPAIFPKDNFSVYLEQFKKEAIKQGVSINTINREFKSIQYIQRVIEEHKYQPDHNVTTTEYLEHVLPESKILLAMDNYKKYQPLLNKISQHYKVQPNYLVSLWGLESSFGRMQGNVDILSALSSLLYDGQRKDFFEEQLIDALKIIDRGYATREQLKGSWAGAMGQLQFIPTSLLMYGQDWDRDGRINIWSDEGDVFASIANFLASKGWDENSSWGQSVEIADDSLLNLSGIKDEQAKPLSQWIKLGVKLSQPIKDLKKDQSMWLITPDKSLNSAYLVSNNFRIIMHWNYSYDYALSVCLLAEKIQ